MKLVFTVVFLAISIRASSEVFKDRSHVNSYPGSKQSCVDHFSSFFTGSSVDNNFDETEQFISLRNGQIAHIIDGKLSVISDNGTNSIDHDSCMFDKKSNIGKFMADFYRKRSVRYLNDYSPSLKDSKRAILLQMEDCSKYYPDVENVRVEYLAKVNSSTSDRGASKGQTAK